MSDKLELERSSSSGAGERPKSQQYVASRTMPVLGRTSAPPAHASVFRGSYVNINFTRRLNST